MSALGYIYGAIGAAVLGFYGLTALNGWEYGDPHRHVVPAAERRPGWTRSTPHTHSTFWFLGYRGGK